MAKKTPIQINIPRPCHEHWNEMSVTEKGRFCQSCQKEVINFSNWSDIAIYSFLKQQNGAKVCGRFCNTQLNRPINIPPQPHSRLYKLFVGLGMTLLFVSAIPTLSYAQAPLININESPNLGEQEPHLTNDTIIISGVVVDATKEPVIGATIILLKKGYYNTHTSTDINGKFKIAINKKDNTELSLRCAYSKYKPVTILITQENISDYHTISLASLETGSIEKIIINEYTVPPVNLYKDRNYILTGEVRIESIIPPPEAPPLAKPVDSTSCNRIKE